MIVAAIAIGGGVGAVLRWWADLMLPRPSGFPLGITIVNVLGSFAFGVVVGLDVAASAAWSTPFTVGVLGGFTTYSTWMADIDRAETMSLRAATLAVPLVLGMAAAALGVVVGARAG